MKAINRTVRAGIAAATLVGALSLAEAPASAGTKTTYASSGTTMWADWIEMGPLTGVAGNVHMGYLFVDGSTKQPTAWGGVSDWTCPPGELPYGGGHGGPVADEHPPPPENNCTSEGFRDIYGEPGAITFTLDKKLTTGRLTGTLTVSSHGGPGTARPPVDMTLSGYGSPYTYSGRGKFSDGTSTTTYSYRSTSRSATIEGRIGAMDFTDDADDQSSASMGTFKDVYRTVTR